MQRVAHWTTLALAVIDQHDEVGQVAAHRRAEAVGHFEAEVVVLDVGEHPGVRLGDAAELGLPVAVEDHPVEVAAARVGLPAVGLRGGEADVGGGAGGVVGVEHRLDRALALEGVADAAGDAGARHVGQFLIHELGRIRAALAL